MTVVELLYNSHITVIELLYNSFMTITVIQELYE